MSTIKLSAKAISKLSTELKQTSGFSLSVEFHCDRDKVLIDMNEEDVFKFFKKHQELLSKLPVSTLDNLAKI